MKFNIFSFPKDVLVLAVAFMTPIAYSQDTTSHADNSQWAAYSESIKNCTPGTFEVPDVLQEAVLQTVQKMGASVPSPASAPPITYTIVGWQAGKCQVKISLPASPLDKTGAGQTTMTCAFPQDSLSTLSDYAAKIASGTFSASTDDPTSQLTTSACTASQ